MGIGKRLACLAMGAALWAGPVAVRAQALADRIPADAILYVGWRGTNDLGPSYATSNLKGLLDNTNIREQVEGLIARGMEDAAKADPKKAEGAKTAKALMDAAVKYPTAVYFGGLDFADAKQPQPKIAIISEAGAEAQALADVLNKAIAGNPDKKSPAEAKVVGKYVVLKIGKPEGIETLLGAGDGKGSLAQDKEFTAALGQVQKGAVITVYVNAHAALQMASDGAAQKGPPMQAQNFAKAIDALNLNAFEDFIGTGSFDGKMWASQAFLGLDKGRGGLASFFDSKPLSADVLKLIPKSAEWAGVLRLDLARVLTEMREGMDRVTEGGGRQFDMAIQQAPNFIGVDPKDLAGALGNEWVYYGSADAVGNSIHGATIINHLKNEKAALNDLQDLEDFVNGKLSQRGGPDTPSWKTSEVTSKVEGVGKLEIHSLALPQLTPSWTVSGGNLVFSLSPQGVQSAVEGLAKKAESIEENPDFMALRKKLEAGAEGKLTSFSYTDLVKTAPEAYVFVNFINAAIAQKAGDKAPPFALPGLDQIKPYLSSAGSVFWNDDAGWHQRSLSPFPGATALGGEQLLMEMAAGKISEQANAARGGAMRASAANGLKQVGLGLMTYATDQGTLPPDLGSLVAKGFISNDASGLGLFAGPNVKVPDAVLQGTKAEQADWVNQNTHYVYLGAGKKLADIANPATTPLAYEKLDTAGNRPIGVLFADGHVEMVARAKAQTMFTK